MCGKDGEDGMPFRGHTVTTGDEAGDLAAGVEGCSVVHFPEPGYIHQGTAGAGLYKNGHEELPGKNTSGAAGAVVQQFLRGDALMLRHDAHGRKCPGWDGAGGLQAAG